MRSMRTERSILVSVTLLWIGHFFVDFMLGIWPVYKTMAGLDIAVAGTIAACCAFLGEGMQLLFGGLCDKGFKKRLILFGLFFTSANVLLIFTENYFILFALFFLTCMGSGAFHPAATALVGGFTENRKSFYIALFSSGGALGLAVSQIIYSNLLTTLQNHVVLIAAPSLLLVLFLLLFGYFKREDEARSKTAPFTTKNFKYFFKNRELLSLYVNQVCNQTIAWAAIFLLPDVLVSRGYSSTISFGGGHLAFIIGSAIMMIPSGYLADKYSSQRIMLIATFVGMILFYTFLFSPRLETTPLLVILFFMGAAIGVIQPVAVAFGNILCKSNPGMVSAFLMGMVWCVSEFLGPAGGGLLTKCFVEDAPAKALSLIGVLFIVSLVATSLLPRRETEIFSTQKTIASFNMNTV
ncbi:Permease, major facilitator superfamily [Chlamydiales bacterium STE3]|nr:Permease, major facilitator superfamily [Chlamydiales bacterium STE3]